MFIKFAYLLAFYGLILFVILSRKHVLDFFYLLELLQSKRI